jgi:hemerythrin-like domain-containing protein
MMDCHRRIEKFLDMIREVARERRGSPLPDEHRRALATALVYFAEAAPHHTADEEASLFPRMRATDDPRIHAALERLEKLEADHRRAEHAHARVDEFCRRWLDDDRLPESEADELIALLDELKQTYERHIRLEDEEVFPLAGRTLDANQIKAVGREMRERRHGPT